MHDPISSPTRTLKKAEQSHWVTLAFSPHKFEYLAFADDHTKCITHSALPESGSFFFFNTKLARALLSAFLKSWSFRPSVSSGTHPYEKD